MLLSHVPTFHFRNTILSKVNLHCPRPLQLIGTDTVSQRLQIPSRDVFQDSSRCVCHPTVMQYWVKANLALQSLNGGLILHLPFVMQVESRLGAGISCCTCRNPKRFHQERHLLRLLAEERLIYSATASASHGASFRTPG